MENLFIFDISKKNGVAMKCLLLIVHRDIELLLKPLSEIEG